MTIWISLALLAASAGIVALAAAFSTGYVQINAHRLRANQLATRCRIVQISDLHGRTRFWNGSVSKLVNLAQPDIVCVTGDLATSRGQLPRVLDELRRLSCHSVVFVPGNYEREERVGLGKRRWTDAEYEDTVRELQDIGIRVLDNGALRVQGPYGSVELLGFDNSIYGNESFEHSRELPGRQAGFRIAIAHSPSIIDKLESHAVRFDLLLTGHTHGGQIRLFSRTFGAYKQFHSGMKKLSGNRCFYINRGLGTVKLPLRLNCFPEIAVFDLERG